MRSATSSSPPHRGPSRGAQGETEETAEGGDQDREAAHVVFRPDGEGDPGVRRARRHNETAARRECKRVRFPCSDRLPGRCPAVSWDVRCCFVGGIEGASLQTDSAAEAHPRQAEVDPLSEPCALVAHADPDGGRPPAQPVPAHIRKAPRA
eukprot:gene8118-biopygen3722